jgi:PAS domain S-box-containing protein
VTLPKEDVSARLRAEEELLRTKEALRESQDRLTAALRAAGTGTFRWHIGPNAIEADANLNRLLGLASAPSPATLDQLIALAHPGDRPALVAAFEDAARDSGDLDIQFRVVWPDGSAHWLEAKAKVLGDGRTQPLIVTGACSDISTRRAAEEIFRANEERLRAIFNQAAVGIAIADLWGRFLDMNRKFSDILGYSAAELRQFTFADLTHPDDRAQTNDCVKRLLARSIADYSLEHRYVRRDGSVVWSLSTVTLLTDAAGQPQSFIGVIEDITSRKTVEADNARLYEASQQSAEERRTLLESERAARSTAERMSHLKDEFLATLSHELRTPLNAILGWSMVLRGDVKIDPAFTKGLEAIERNARVQTQLIEDLLDMSRITSGKLRLDVQSMSPVAFIEAALETVKPAADAKGIHLEKEFDPLAGPISGDANRLQQVTWNLLSNAIKFTPRDGTITITLTRVHPHVEIAVADTGIGIAPEFLPNIFDRFRQGDASTTREHGGLGLGLAIVKNLVELHGGSVRVQSPGRGGGTTVTVELPLSAAHGKEFTDRRRARDAPMPSPTAPDDLRGLRVLIVDDQDDARELIRRVLEDAAADVIEASAADEAVTLIERERPDILVSDIGMPDADGFDLLRRVRMLDAAHGGTIPAIALTAFARSEDRTRALRAGFLVHVAKPVDPSELVATVASVARRIDGR